MFTHGRQAHIVLFLSYRFFKYQHFLEWDALKNTIILPPKDFLSFETSTFCAKSGDLACIIIEYTLFCHLNLATFRPISMFILYKTANDYYLICQFRCFGFGRKMGVAATLAPKALRPQTLKKHLRA